MSGLPYDEVPVGKSRVVITVSRPRGLDTEGRPHREPLPSVVTLGAEDATAMRSAERQMLTDLGIKVDSVYFALVTGSAGVAFIDKSPQVSLDEDGYHSINDVDGLFGYANTIKACRLGDCGLLVVTGLDSRGRYFDGFLHTTRLNLNGDDQFSDSRGQPVGGVELMLQKMLAHYQPQSVSLRLVAGIAPQFYIHNFEPGAAELAKEPGLTAETKKQQAFREWEERGWLEPVGDGWYQADMYAAVRHQIERAGLLDTYSDEVALNGDPASGHASHRAARLGLVEETRDLYLLIPNDYVGKGHS